jgi:hypothetical protein
MDIRKNLRELFVHSNFTSADESAALEEGTVEMDSATLCVFKKAPDQIVFVIGDEGENIAVQKPSRVARYAGAPEHIEGAIQDRFHAVLEAAANHANEAGHRQVSPNQVIPFLGERLGRKPLRALIANKKTAESLKQYIHEVVYDYGHGAMPDDVLFGVSEPKYVGHVVVDQRKRPGPVMMMEDESGNLVPWPGAVESHVGIMVHGPVVGVRVKR